MIIEKIIEQNVQKFLEENNNDFVDSLRLSSIDVERGVWTADAVDKNAQAGALSIIRFASQNGVSEQSRNTFLRTVAENLNEEESFSVLAWIYAGFVQTGQFPPYAIIQHMIDPLLFREYCVALQKHLHIYLQGYFTEVTNIV